MLSDPASSTSASKPIRTYNVYHPDKSLANLLIMSPSSNKPIYDAQKALNMKNVPEIRLFSVSYHAVPEPFSDQSPNTGKASAMRASITAAQARTLGHVVGEAHFEDVCKTHRIRLCIGDPDKGSETRWWQMLDRKRGHGEYVLNMSSDQDENAAARIGFVNEFDNSFDLGLSGLITNGGMEKVQANANQEEQQPNLRWVRTHSRASGLDNPWISRKLGLANFKLVDGYGRVVAVFETNGVKSFRRMGKLKVFDAEAAEIRDAGNDFFEGSEHRNVDFDEIVMVLSCCVILEKFRRGI